MKNLENNRLSQSVILSNIDIGRATETTSIHRELSWLAFNSRVLEEANTISYPLLERLRFLSISDHNLDEFYMVRVAAYKADLDICKMRLNLKFNPHKKSLSRKSFQQSIQDQIIQETQFLINEQVQIWHTLKQELKTADFHIKDIEELTREQIKWLKQYFHENIFSTLSPLAIDPTHPFPWIPNQGLAIALILKNEITNLISYEILSLPFMMHRFVQIPSDSLCFVPLEQIIVKFHSLLLPEFKIIEHGIFHVIRDTEFEQEEDIADLAEYYEIALKRRRHGNVIRITVNKNMSLKLKRFVVERVNGLSADLYTVDNFVRFGDVAELISAERPDLKFHSYVARSPKRIADFGGDCFAAIEYKDLIVHHPFETFDTYIKFLRQAAHDPHVLVIKQTLYRTSQDSPVVQELMIAAEKGKTVIALIEIRARFDEEKNIHFARDLEKAGVQVVYGFLKLKTHAKVTLIVRREGGKTKSYAHVGTGNYHPDNALLYTDLSFFTANPAICEDISLIFNYITGGALPKKLKKLAISPLTLRSTLMALIQQEIRFAQEKKPASLWIKVNSLVDIEIIDLLYKASQEGVKIILIVRGICCLRPGVKGLSENIIVKSIIGRFLEHSRIFCFGNGHKLPSPHAKIYISSSDWMTRNFDHRVEIMLPIENSTVHQQIMNEIMNSYIKDEAQTWLMQHDGTYKKFHLPPTFDSLPFSAHDYLMKQTSLSGRGLEKS